ncbi:MAG: peptide-methionine (R)-S-oxide reductase [Bacteroidota bacterium]|jgi:methionine-R-sulfoxide reductase
MKFGISLLLILTLGACQAQEKTQSLVKEKSDTMKYNELTPQEERVLLQKATDRPFTGDYYDKKDAGMYLCRRCNNPLYLSDDKFDSHCGWPSFDDEIDGAVKRVPDSDGFRTEIICMNCGGHLGHVFLGEGFTDKDTRHCVNTSSLRFVPKSDLQNLPPVIK